MVQLHIFITSDYLPKSIIFEKKISGISTGYCPPPPKKKCHFKQTPLSLASQLLFISCAYSKPLSQPYQKHLDTIIIRYPEFTLPDGSIRTTFASESNGHDANEQYPSCLRESSHVISKTFDDVFR